MARIKASEEFKRNLETVCFIQWPCRSNICDRDYSVPCPLGWKHHPTSNLCESPVEYSSGPQFFPFGKIPLNQRPTLEKKMLVDYPCIDRSQCVDRDYTRCPVGWLSSFNSKCIPPPNHPCKEILYLLVSSRVVNDKIFRIWKNKKIVLKNGLV